MKKTNVLVTTVLALAMVAMSACGGTAAPTAAPVAPTTPVAVVPSVAPAGDPATEPTAGADADAPAGDGALVGPYMVTSCGQSPGAVMINMVAMQEGLTSSNDNGLTAETFTAADYKTLIVTTGTSGKGMGAAGTDVNAEIERCVALIKAAKEAGVTIVGAHVEGMARRTDSADASSIESIMALADVILVIEESDSDGFFTKYAEDNSKTLIKVKDALEIATVL